MKFTIIKLLLVVSVLSACNNSDNKISENKNTVIDTLKKLIKADCDSIVYDDFNYPIDSVLTTKILPVATFHGDEVIENASQLNWIGLFKGKNGHYLKKTKIKTIKVYDLIVDENENDKTGCEVQVLSKDTCLIVIEPLDYLSERNIQAVNLAKYQILPGDTISFKYLDKDYKIFATGCRRNNKNDSTFYEIWNYRLYITTIINGQTINTLLVAKPGFQDNMVSILFAGDIDGDGILDLIIDTSYHYNLFNPTIYLSKPANKGEIVKPIGSHYSVGC